MGSTVVLEAKKGRRVCRPPFSGGRSSRTDRIDDSCALPEEPGLDQASFFQDEQGPFQKSQGAVSDKLRDDISNYFRVIARIPLLSHEQERKLTWALAKAHQALMDCVYQLPLALKLLAATYQKKIDNQKGANGALTRLTTGHSQLQAAIKASEILFQREGRLSQKVVASNAAIACKSVQKLAAWRDGYESTDFAALLPKVEASLGRLTRQMAILEEQSGVSLDKLLSGTRRGLSAPELYDKCLSGVPHRKRSQVSQAIEATCSELELWQKDNMLPLDAAWRFAGEFERHKSSCTAARNELSAANTRLVASVARDRRPMTMSLEEAIAEGNVGLLEAAARFDPSTGRKFSTYATYWIWQAMTRSPTMQGVVMLPRSGEKNRADLHEAWLTLSEVLHREPSWEELAKHLKWSDRKVRQVAMQLKRFTSALGQTGDDDQGPDQFENRPAQGIRTDPMESAARRDNLQALAKLINRLFSGRERLLLSYRLGFAPEDGMFSVDHPMPGGFTLEETGKVVRVTRERVRQIEGKSLRKLRSYALVGLMDEPAREALVARTLRDEVQIRLVNDFFSDEPLPDEELPQLLGAAEYARASRRTPERVFRDLSRRRDQAINCLAAELRKEGSCENGSSSN